MKVKVDVKLNNKKIKQLTSAQITAAKKTAEQMLHEIVTEQRMPFDEGTLQNVQSYVDSKDASKGIVLIAHETPYAARLYFHPEYNFDKTINKRAGGLWWDEWLVGKDKDRAAKLYAYFYQKEGGTK